jgi:phospholipid/cholesterol/gamma-HCH transport system substrate-binding protein
VIKYVIDQLPPTLAGLIRTADYGSWFNFYLCTVSVILDVPGRDQAIQKDLAVGKAARCH